MARFSLLSKLLLAILLPTVFSFAGFAVLGHFAAARALETELGRRLSAIAAVAATQISEDSVALLAPGDENSRTYHNLRRRLLEVRDAAGVARVYLFSADLKSRVDTDEVPIGTPYYGLQTSRAELRQVFPLELDKTPARPVSSLLFRGSDGKLYKSGYAPIAATMSPEQAPERPRFAVGVDGSAALYADLLGLRKTLLWVGCGGVLSLVVLATLFGLGLTRPLRRLLESARLMGTGVFDRPVQLTSARDEVNELAAGLEAMRQALSARDERMQMMLSGIAHEVRNPLGGMELFAGLLGEELQSPALELPTLQSYVQRIRKELYHLQAVVNDFLEYARRSRPVLAPLAVAELLAEVGDSVRASAPAEVVVAVRPPGRPLVVDADATQLRRVLLNLAHNAVQACAAVPATDPRPRTVELSVTTAPAPPSPEGMVLVTVRDSGPGISDEALPKIWTPFFTTRAQGTGLGLAFVREIVRDHSGVIDVTTSSAGTTFAVILPASRTLTPAPQ
jgi:signal transduction histidine kinase